MKKRPDIQGLRAIAVLSVIAYHAGLPVPGGFIGVDIFFVISGFVITLMIARELAETKKFDLARFYVRRFKRLTPALVIVVVFTLMVSVFFLSPFGAQQTVAYTGLGAVFLSANAAIALTTGGYFDAAADNNPLLHMWSLSVEEQFYIVFPALLVFVILWAKRRGIKVRIDVLVLVLLTAVSFILAVAASSNDLDARAEALLGFYSPISRAWEFGLGALVALLSQRLTRLTQKGWLAGTSAVLGVVFLVAGFVLITSETAWPGVWTFLPVAGSVLLLVAGLNQSNVVSHVLGSRPLALVGDWSYSLYLWHWPFIVFAGILWPENDVALLVAAIFSIAPALVVYYKIENPLRFAPVPNLKKAALLGLAFLLVPALAVSGLLIGANAKWGVEWGSSSVQSDHIAFDNCVDKAFNPKLCTWHSANTTGTILLVGDSQAYSYADGLVSAAQGLGFNTIVTSTSGCPFGSLDSAGSQAVDCVSWQKQILDFALQTSPSLVVIANRSSGYSMPESGWRTLLDGDGNRATPQNASALYEESLLGVVESLADANIPVLILQNIPSIPNSRPGRSGYTETIFAKFFAANNTAAFPTAAALEFAQRGRAAESAVHDLTEASLFDPFAALCSESTCRMFTDNVRIYQDYGHLSPQGSLALSDALRSSISRATGR